LSTTIDSRLETLDNIELAGDRLTKTPSKSRRRWRRRSKEEMMPQPNPDGLDDKALDGQAWTNFGSRNGPGAERLKTAISYYGGH
jgi:hypothetical protein